MNHVLKQQYCDFQPMQTHVAIQCNRGMIKSLLLQQWNGLSNAEIEATRYIKTRIAELLERRYGIHQRLAENYLSNLERTLPL